ncbi:hypothetical protein BJX63DRAFT_436333 [Aspergillus granulosus]|uniref:HMG box domain-containing protein n=1 Tax=Aspergillus granulosus TaxID=176169 RepID=A0ABR4GZ11_9EURO
MPPTTSPWYDRISSSESASVPSIEDHHSDLLLGKSDLSNSNLGPESEPQLDSSYQNLVLTFESEQAPQHDQSDFSRNAGPYSGDASLRDLEPALTEHKEEPAIVPKDRVQKSPQRRTRKDKDKEPQTILPGPLSELTKHTTNVPLRDMVKHVHRSIAQRHLEVAEKGGNVTRPMSSFKLYRSANRTANRRTANRRTANRRTANRRTANRRTADRRTADSWARESPEIRAKYIRLAIIEKQNHERAHPGYKFTPEKDKKKRAGSEDGGANERQRTPCRSAPGRSTPAMDSNSWDSSRSTPLATVDHGLSVNGYFPASWPTSNPSRSSLSGSMLPSQYVQSTANHALVEYNVEGVHAWMGNVDLGEMQYPSSCSMMEGPFIPGPLPSPLPGALADAEMEAHTLVLPRTIQIAPEMQVGNEQVQPNLVQSFNTTGIEHEQVGYLSFQARTQDLTSNDNSTPDSMFWPATHQAICKIAGNVKFPIA